MRKKRSHFDPNLRTRRGVLPSIGDVVANGTDESHQRDDENEGLLSAVGIEDGRKQGEVGASRDGDLDLSFPAHVRASESRKVFGEWRGAPKVEEWRTAEAK